MNDAQARERIRNDLDTTLVVEAAAGTGKTTELVERIVSLIRSGRAELARIVAVTFTEKAAGELKLRLRGEIERARARDAGAAALLDRALIQLEAAHIGTIHSFCADLLRERPIEAAIDPEFRLLSEAEAERAYEAAFERWWYRVLRDPPEGVRRVLAWRTRPRDARTARSLLRRAGLSFVRTRDFDAAWAHPEGFDRLGEIARVREELTTLAALQGRATDPRSTLSRALGALARFLEDLERREARLGPDDDVLEAELRWLRTNRRVWDPKGRTNERFGGDITRAEVLAERDRVRKILEDFCLRAGADLAARLREDLSPLVAAYEDAKRHTGALDFLDLLLRTRDLVRDRPDVRAQLQARYTHFLIDEVQDTDPLQFEILLLLASRDPGETRWQRALPAPGKLFMVGDPKQSIYRFRRADVALYESVKRRLCENGAELLHLGTSFRADPAIQEFVNSAFAPRMKADETGSQADYVPLARAREPIPDHAPVIALPIPVTHDTDQWGNSRMSRKAIDGSLPNAAAGFIHWLIEESGWRVTERGGPPAGVPIRPGHIAILFKRLSVEDGDVAGPYARALAARRIPYTVSGGRSFHAREEVLAMRNALAAIERPDDELSVYATLRGPLFSVPDEALLTFKQRCGKIHPFIRSEPDPDIEPATAALAVLASLHKGRNQRPIAETLERLLDATRAHAGFASWSGGAQALANVLHVIELARSFEAEGATSFRAFVELLRSQAEHGEVEDAQLTAGKVQTVQLLTVHKAKGLEFPIVILADPCAQPVHKHLSHHADGERRLWLEPIADLIPAELAANEALVRRREADESLRLLYVAATRARDFLVIPICEGERVGGWLGPLEETIEPRPPQVERFDLSRLALAAPPDAPFDEQELFRAEGGGTERERAAGEEVERWSTRRAQILEAGGKPSIQITLATERSDAKLALIASEPEPELEATERAGEPRPRGPRFGSLVHAVMSDVPFDADREAVAAFARGRARQLNATSEERSAAVDAVEAALRHPLLAEARAAERRGECHREAPIACVITGAELLQGTIDLCFRDKTGWTLVDYKTDPELVHRSAYASQLRAYTAALRRATGEAVRAVMLRV